MPFGLKNDAHAFQRLMDSILCKIPSILVYLDEILLASTDFMDHANHLCHVLQLLSCNGLVVKWSWSVFRTSKLTYPGHCVNAAGISLLPSGSML